MVGLQLKARGINDPRVLTAFRGVPRELFVPAEYRDLAYADGPVSIGGGQTISQPYTVAAMSEALKPEASDRVLEIDTGSGYQAAILCRLVAKVYTVERIESLARRAETVWRQSGIRNYESRVGDGTKGWPEEAPFDKIMVTAAAAKVPPAIFEQLKVGGIMVAPVGGPEVQELTRYTKQESGVRQEFLGLFRFVPLIADNLKKSPKSFTPAAATSCFWWGWLSFSTPFLLDDRLEKT